MKKTSALHRDAYDRFAEPIRKALAIGLNVPTAHNTQPFKFRILNDTDAELYVDETRLLPQTDPPARQIHISCGCLIETLIIGATLIGYRAQVITFPRGQYSQEEIGEKPFASIKLIADDHAIVNPLADYIFKRQTSRLVYRGDMISDKLAATIKNMTKSEFSNLTILNRTEELRPYLEIFKEAMRIESFNPATNEETRRMFRFSPEEIEAKRDGLTFGGQGIKGLARFFASRAVKNTEESWNKESNVMQGLKNFNRGVDSAQGLVFWVTETNTLPDWMNVGRDIMRFWLVLSQNGIYAHPLNQAIQEFREMDAERKKLDELFGVKEGQKIQMIVRIGHSDRPYYSYRRHLSSFIMPD